MPKNIVICCDGTNNQLETPPTNVLRLYGALPYAPGFQPAYYDPGVGTVAWPRGMGPVRKRLSLTFGSAFGWGFTRNLEEAYRFLMLNYQREDCIFLFGFSRGAFTVRALAGMLRMFGLLRPDQENLLPYVSRAYKAANFDVAKRVLRVSQRNVYVDFLGLWDTVSSLGFSYRRKALPYTANNRKVHVIRQALAIDERRAYFRQNRWGRKYEKQQDVKEVWFAGVHSDVGGGYPEEDNTLSMIPLQWMIEEARREGLLIDPGRYARVLGGQACGQEVSFAPDAGAKTHESLTGPWWIVEFLPMNYTRRRGDFRVPLARRRRIEGDAVVHQSVIDRIVAHQDSYQPPNLGRLGKPEPWSAGAKPGTPSPPEPKCRSARLREAVKAGAWVVGAAYIAVFLAILLLLLTFDLARGFFCGEGWPPHWWQRLLSAVTWPGRAVAWLTHPGHARAALLLAGPLIVLWLGAWAIDAVSGLRKFKARVWGRLLHLRWRGYNRALAEKQLKYLRPNGRQAYLRMLRLDLGFPVFYGAALLCALPQAFSMAGNAVPSWIPSWVTLLPLVTVASDWIENLVLLWQVSRYPGKPLHAWAIGVASAATVVKIATFTASLLGLASLLLLAL